jgi:hypothetical protein
MEIILPSGCSSGYFQVKLPLAWSPDGRLLASAAKDGAVCVESVENE